MMFREVVVKVVSALLVDFMTEICIEYYHDGNVLNFSKGLGIIARNERISARYLNIFNTLGNFFNLLSHYRYLAKCE